ncbi:hypothetical protein REPUB_Repub04eG0108600 [Reevesia pubescens]
MFHIGIWNYRFRPRYLPHMDTKFSWVDTVNLDELDEEFDTFPTSKPHYIVRMRYDRLRSVAGRIKMVVAVVLYATPFRLVAMLVGLYYMRHPRFWSKLPSIPTNFFKRLDNGPVWNRRCNSLGLRRSDRESWSGNS